ncbi:NAD-dependent epimerase/dehydratase family protein [Chryseolinea soli]|uniref:NAD-dependent epimerase/dehydratase family protein n=1 Tax=Chryseolinea soli TaxID=2321403 RepID=A0A385SI39_9BACT|nr:NAD-dependent epimerase/dehydratase family protein [Chryseolinea soli]AYB30121.1 NAD-dependent epimerase/dehydratase family protein [Chryseolinea soli]
MKTALIAGSTGLIGSQLLSLLLKNPEYVKVIALTRVDLAPHPKLTQIKVEFGSLGENSSALKADDVYCCLGTTMAKAGSKENFYQVDFYYPFLLAKTSRSVGAKKFMLVSALGANKSSSIYYNQVKGEIEEAISSVAFDAVHIFRPSLLLGPRTEKRSAEDAAKFFYKALGFLIPKKYKAIQSAKVARAMQHFAAEDKKGIFIHESADLQRF